jgi:hypothetical protein
MYRWNYVFISHTTITVIDHSMSLSVLYMTFTPGFWWGQCCSSFQFSVQGFWFCLYVFILCLVPKVACIPGLSFPDFPCSFLYVYLARDLSSESRTFELQKYTTLPSWSLASVDNMWFWMLMSESTVQFKRPDNQCRNLDWKIRSKKERKFFGNNNSPFGYQFYVYLARDLSSESRTFELQKYTTQYDNIWCLWYHYFRFYEKELLLKNVSKNSVLEYIMLLES